MGQLERKYSSKHLGDEGVTLAEGPALQLATIIVCSLHAQGLVAIGGPRFPGAKHQLVHRLLWSKWPQLTSPNASAWPS